ncbi:MAG: SAVED domain-containing protein [Myxococcota bacterium]|jgi:hypothetical protein|nr:SAVED domain-containing protein [Myxococcota bacterium]
MTPPDQDNNTAFKIGGSPSPIGISPGHDDLGFDFALAVPWFHHEEDEPYVLVRVSDDHARAWSSVLGLTVRRCFMSDAIVSAQSEMFNVSAQEVIAASLPDPGATMSGDFGEILVYLYQGAKALPTPVLGAKKWRLKQDRTKPAPKSDVVHFVLPAWPTATEKDAILCAEVKSKATKGKSSPIREAIDDSLNRDQVSRLTDTLVWLHDRILTGASLGDVQRPHLQRFINATDHPAFEKRFSAVAVVCASLIDDELKHAPTIKPEEYTVVVIAVPDLKGTYSSVFEAAMAAAPPGTSP